MTWAGAARSASRAASRPASSGAHRLLEAEEARRLGLQAAVDPARDEPVVVVAADQHELAVRPQRAPEVGEHVAGQLGRVALRRSRAARARRRGSRAGRRPPRPRAAARAGRGGGAGPSASGSRGGDRRRRASALVRRLGSAPVTAGPGPLDGLLVADFSRVLAGPFAAMTLGDLGADVIKVERPEAGDDTRHWGPPWRDGESDLLPGAQPQQALGRARPRRRGRPRAGARAGRRARTC